MPIIVKINGTKNNIEGKFNLTFKRKREDIKDVLIKIKNGRNLFDLFPSSIAQSLQSQFIKNGYIDSNQQIQENGNRFIDNPFKSENEISIYSIDLFTFEIAGVQRQIIINLTRRLTNDERQSSDFNLGNIVKENELQINDEKIYFDDIRDISKRVYIASSENTTVTFTIDDGMYNAGFGFKSVGNIEEVLAQYTKDIINSKQTYFTFTNDMQGIVIKSLKDFSILDLMNGTISKIEIDNIEIVNVPFVIDDLKLATEYAYLFIYQKISEGEYLSINEMNELFENEVLSKPIFAGYIKENLLGFTYSEDGFSKYLEKSKYEDMSYKLNVMKTLLDVDIKDTRLHNVRNYFDLTNYLTGIISPNDVNRINLVLGYSMAKNQKNKIIDCIEALLQKYNNITIIAKNDGSGQKTDDSIKESILTHGVQLKTNVEIGKNFHDRYILFEMKDGTYKCMLATNEVGQFFNLETSEPLGSIMVISNDEIIKAGKSLITMVKEAK